MSRPLKIPFVNKGGRRNGLSATLLNQIISRLNALCDIRIMRGTAHDDVQYSDNNVALILHGLDPSDGGGGAGRWRWANSREYDSTLSYQADEAVIVSPDNAAISGVATGAGTVYSVAGIYICLTGPTTGDDDIIHVPTWPLPGTPYWMLLSFYPSEITVCVDGTETPYYINAQENVTH